MTQVDAPQAPRLHEEPMAADTARAQLGHNGPLPTHPDGDSYVVPAGLWARQVGAALLALALGVAAGVLLMAVLPDTTPGNTDVAGYPAAFGFDVGWYRSVYILWVAVVPVLTAAAYASLRRWARPFRHDTAGDTIEIRRIGVGRESSAATPVWVAAGRAAAVAAVLGLQVGVVGQPRWGWSPLVCVVVLVVGSIGASILASRARGQRGASALNLAGSVAVVIGLYGVSRSTWIDVQTERIFLPWLPAWLAILGALSVVAVLALLVRRRGWERADEISVSIVVGSVAVFMLTSWVPGVIGWPDVFHSGEKLVGARLLAEGNVPWRDFLAIHGLTFDSFIGMSAAAVTEDSFWGLVAVETMLWGPITLVGTYVVGAVVLGRNPFAHLVLLVGVVSSGFIGGGDRVVGGLLGHAHTRMILVPLVLLSLIGFARKSGVGPGFAFTTVLFVVTLTTPEAAYFVPAAAGALLVADLADRDPSRVWWRQLRRVVVFVASGAALSLAFGLWALAVGALDDFVFMLRTFASDHELTGGIPVQWGGFGFAVAAYLTPVASVATLAFVTIRYRRRRLDAIDVPMLALALFMLPYYTKFLSRADGHVYQPWAMAIPLVVYVIRRCIDIASSVGEVVGASSRSDRRYQLAATTVVALVMLFPWMPVMRELDTHVSSVGVELQPVIAQPSIDPQLGFVTPTPFSDLMVPDLRMLLDGPELGQVTLFDFTNQPGVYHYLIDADSPTRYPHVSMAIRDRNQEDLIDQLKETRPDVVAFGSTNGGLPSWDGLTNQVRHHDVSEWILRNYEPWIFIHGQTLMRHRNSQLPDADQLGVELAGTPVIPDLASSIPACDFHQLPERLPFDGGAFGEALPVTRVDTLARIAGWAARDGIGPRRILLIADGRIVGAHQPVASRVDLGFREEELVQFDFQIPLVGEPASVVVAADWGDGTISPLPPLSEDFAIGLDLSEAFLSNSGLTMDPIGIGTIELAERQKATNGRLTLRDGRSVIIDELLAPPNATDASWLQLDAAGLDSETIELTDRLNDPTRRISVTSTDADDLVRLQVGACAQWFGMPGDTRWIIRTESESPIAARLAAGSA